MKTRNEFFQTPQQFFRTFRAAFNKTRNPANAGKLRFEPRETCFFIELARHENDIPSSGFVLKFDENNVLQSASFEKHSDARAAHRAFQAMTETPENADRCAQFAREDFDLTHHELIEMLFYPGKKSPTSGALENGSGPVFEWRKRAKMGQKMVAYLLGVSESTVKRWERKGTEPRQNSAAARAFEQFKARIIRSENEPIPADFDPNVPVHDPIIDAAFEAAAREKRTK
mgnify:FL=1